MSANLRIHAGFSAQVKQQPAQHGAYRPDVSDTLEAVGEPDHVTIVCDDDVLVSLEVTG